MQAERSKSLRITTEEGDKAILRLIPPQHDGGGPCVHIELADDWLGGWGTYEVDTLLGYEGGLTVADRGEEGPDGDVSFCAEAMEVIRDWLRA